MAETLLSLGLDLGTATTQLMLSRLRVENRASAFGVPEMEITDREVVYASPVHFTPLLGEDRMDEQAIRAIVEQEYRNAGITREQVDTGAVIVTGESSRKENAARVARSLSALAGEFVVTTAGPDLESVLAARGAGAPEAAAELGVPVVHMDIGGGTCNLALIEQGEIVRTGCLNIGGRLVRREQGRITYVSPVLEGLTPLRAGDREDPEALEQLAELLVQALEMAAGLREPGPLLHSLATREAGSLWEPAPPGAVPSFSGGVADCIRQRQAPDAFGDIGPLLGRAIGESRLCRGKYLLGRETIRATVIGAGCYSTRLSGSTVFCRGISLPLQNLPAAVLGPEEQTDPACIRHRLSLTDGGPGVLALPGYAAPAYARVRELARSIVQGVGDGPVLVCVEQDMAKALGQCLSLLLPADRPCLCIDRLRLHPGDYLDVGEPVGPAFPVVIKTLVFRR